MYKQRLVVSWAKRSWWGSLGRLISGPAAQAAVGSHLLARPTCSAAIAPRNRTVYSSPSHREVLDNTKRKGSKPAPSCLSMAAEAALVELAHAGHRYRVPLYAKASCRHDGCGERVRYHVCGWHDRCWSPKRLWAEPHIVGGIVGKLSAGRVAIPIVFAGRCE